LSTEGDQRIPKPLGIVSTPFGVISKGFVAISLRSNATPKGFAVTPTVYPSFLKVFR
jgi:hypothetical protein